MDSRHVHTLDLNFQGRPQTIAAYLIRHPDGAVLIESGPGSTVPSLVAGLAAHGLTPRDVTHVLLTHIHLDHAGAAGWLARQGAQIFVHPNGAPHLLDPHKLLASAQRIYGDMMERLWGEFLPVPAERLTVLQDSEEVAIGSLRLVTLETPGHADHHHAYLLDGVCFTGDIGGVRMPGRTYIRLPMPPPELHLGKWRTSLARLQSLRLTHIAPTHFGLFADPDAHLTTAVRELDAIERWIHAVMPGLPDDETLRARLLAWYEDGTMQAGVDGETLLNYELANPSWMAVAGIQRYWKKHCQTTM